MWGGVFLPLLVIGMREQVEGNMSQAEIKPR